MKSRLSSLLSLLLVALPLYAQYPAVTVRQIQEVPLDSLLVADTIQSTVFGRWTLQASPLRAHSPVVTNDTVTVTALCVVPAKILTYTQSGYTMLLYDMSAAYPWGGIFARVDNATDTTQAIADGILNVRRGHIIQVTGWIGEFPASSMNSVTQFNLVAGKPITIIGTGTIPPPVRVSVADFYQASYPSGSVRYSTGEQYEGMIVELVDLTVSGKVNSTRGTLSMIDTYGNGISTYDVSKFFTLGHGGGAIGPPDSVWASMYPLIGPGTTIRSLRGLVTTASGVENSRGYRICPLYRGDISFDPPFEDSVDVTFRWNTSGQSGYSVPGEFNGWNQAAWPMADQGGGLWTRTGRLRVGGHVGGVLTGAYEYKFYYSGAEGWPNDPRNHHLGTGSDPNSIVYVRDPTIYHFIPNQRSGTVNTPTPTISAYLYPKAGSAVDTLALSLTIDGTTYGGIGRFYDFATQQFTYPVATPLSDGSHTAIIRVGTSADTASFDVQAASNPGSAYLSATSRIRVADSDPVNPAANPAAYSITGNTMTVESWIFPMGAPPHHEKDFVITRPYYSGNLVEPFQAYELCIDNTGATDDPRIEFVISDGQVPGNWGRVRDTQPVAVGSWTHVAGTYDGANVRLYVNGALVSSTPYGANIGPGNTGLYIGGLASNYFNGLIDEVRLWNTCRSQTQIQTYRDSTLHGNEEGLAGNWPLDKDTTINGKTPVTVDRTANHNDLWVQRGARFVGTVPGMEPFLAPEFPGQSALAIVGQPLSLMPDVYGWPLPALSLLSGPTGMTFDPGTRVIHWTPSGGQRGSCNVEMRATNTAGTLDFTLFIWVEGAPTQFVEHNNNGVKLFVGNNGMLGRDSVLGGFELNGVNGLFEGDLLLGKSGSQVSGALYAREFGVETSIRPFTSNLTGFDQAYEASYNDQRSGNPVGVSILQRSHSKSTNPDRSYVILEYVITNTSGTAINGLYVGLGLDLDVGNASNNLCGYDPARSLAYVYEAGGATNPYYYGVAAVVGTISGYAFPAPGTVPTEAEYYQGLTTSGGVPVAPGDQRVVLGCGPYNIPAGGSARVVFAMVAGTNFPDLQASTDAARAVATMNIASAYLKNRSMVRVLDGDPVGPDADPSAYQSTGSAITLEGWIFPIGLPRPQQADMILSRPTPSPTTGGYDLAIRDSSHTGEPRISFRVSLGDTHIVVRDTAITVPGAWQHVAGTYDGSTARLYVNGNLVASVPYPGTIAAGQQGLFIGGQSGSTSFHGLIDDVRLWSTVRTQSEIRLYKDATLRGDEAGLAGYWPLDEATTVNGKYPVTIDRTSHHNDLWVLQEAEFVGQPEGSAVLLPPEFIPGDQPEATVGSMFSYRPPTGGWPIPTVSFVYGPTGMTFDPPSGSVSWSPSSTQSGFSSMRFRAANEVGAAESTFAVWANALPTVWRTHNNSAVTLHVTNNGVLGKSESATGFLFNGKNGLWEATVIVGRSSHQVSGTLYTREFAVQDTFRSIPSYFEGFDQAFETRFTDQRVTNPIGIQVMQRSHSKSTSPDRNYVVLDYEIMNTSGAQLNDISVGLVADMDVGNAPDDLCNYDAERGLLYTYEIGGANNSNYYGLLPLTGSVTGYAAWVNGVDPDQSDSALYYRLRNSVPVPSWPPGDYRQMMGTGPYNIPSGGSVRVMFALVAGENLGALQAGADAARAVQFRSNPTILSVKDVPGDQGGKVTVRWNASSLDDLIHLLPYYSIWRAIPESARPTVTKAGRFGTTQETAHITETKAMKMDAAGKSAVTRHRVQAINGVEYGWEWIADQPAHRFTTYSYTAPTLYDSMSTTSGKHYFLVSAQTSDPFVYYDSNPDSGYSVDNLAPESPQNPLLTPLPQGPIRLAWSRNRVDPDVASYAVYHSTTSGFPLADSTRFWSTLDTTVTDSTTVAGMRYYYRITTIDIHGNESAPTVQLGEEALPIQLAGFTAVVLNGQLVRLDWITLTETNNYGFEVQKSADSSGQFQLIPNSFTPGHGTTLEPHHYVFIDSSARAGRWWYRLKQIDLDGTIHCSDPVCVTIWTEVSENRVPPVFALRQNYPNPFNPATSFQFSIAHCQLTILKVYDVLGSEVATLVNEVKQPGVYTVPWDAGGLASGVYFYRLQAGSYVEVKRLVLLR